MAQIRQHMRSPFPIIVEETTGDESANLLELRNKSGTLLASVDKSGIGTGPWAGGGGGGGLPTLLSQANAGATTLTLTSALSSGYRGKVVLSPYTANAELVQINSVSGTTATLNLALVRTHSAASEIAFIPGGSVSTLLFGCKCDGTDDQAALQAAITQCRAHGVWLDGQGRNHVIGSPLVCPLSSNLRDMQITAVAFSPADLTNAMVMTCQDTPQTFTALASNDTFTTPSNHGIGGAPNKIVFQGASLPSPLVAGRVYATDATPSGTTFKVAPITRTTGSNALNSATINVGDTTGFVASGTAVIAGSSVTYTGKTGTTLTGCGSHPLFNEGAEVLGTTLDLTSDGSGIVYPDTLTLEKIHLDNVYINGNLVTGINGFKSLLQQDSDIRRLRVSNCPGIGWEVAGQQWVCFNTEITDNGIGLSISGSFGYYHGLNIESSATANLKLNGTDHVFSGLHCEGSGTKGSVWIPPGADARSCVFLGPQFPVGSNPCILVESDQSSFMFVSWSLYAGSGTDVVYNDTARSRSRTKAQLAFDTNGYEPYFAQAFGPSGVLIEASKVAAGALPGTVDFRTSNFTAVTGSTQYYAQTNSGNVTATLPTAVGKTGERVRFKRVGSGANTFTIATVSSQTIDDGPTSITPYNHEYVELISDGANWYRVGNKPLAVTSTFNLASIPANTTTTQTVTVTGAKVGDVAIASPYSTIEAGLVWSAYVSAADTVKIQIANVTVGAIDPANADWRVIVEPIL